MITLSRQAKRQLASFYASLVSRRKVHRTYQQTVNLLLSMAGAHRELREVMDAFQAYQATRSRAYTGGPSKPFHLRDRSKGSGDR